MQYRPEIDGLRAVAVLPVILFHAGTPLFSGGYVGVDVFFVISGFLITTIILEALNQDRFSIRSFYERRARRILPALFLVMLTSLPFGLAWMSGAQFRNLLESALSASLFVSNILFWLESGYFDDSIHIKPLIHTWSLGVEEQFYIIFPLSIAFIWVAAKKFLLAALIITAVLSFVAAEIALKQSPSAAFYLAPFRLWELLAGSILALWTINNSQKASDLCAGFGLFLIGLSVVLYDVSTPFPGRYALVPVLGSVFFIAGCTQDTWVGKAMSWRPLVFTGLISYSLYLWHQPLLAFTRIRLGDVPPILVASLIVLSFGLSYLTWRYVERPFRKGKKISKSKLVAASIGVTIVIAGATIVTIVNQGNFIPIVAKDRDSLLIDKDIWVIGDSHAEHLIPGLTAITSGNVINLTGAGCIPFRDVDRVDSRFIPGKCAEKTNASLDRLIAEDPVALVVLSTMGPVYIDNESFKGKDPARITGQKVRLLTQPDLTDHAVIFEKGLRATLEELSLLKNPDIVFAVDIPELGIDHGCNPDAKQIVTPLFPNGEAAGTQVPLRVPACRVSKELYDARARNYRNILDRVLPQFLSIHIFDPTESFCSDLYCKGYDENYGYLYRDVDHLSDRGSRYFADAFARWYVETSSAE